MFVEFNILSVWDSAILLLIIFVFFEKKNAVLFDFVRNYFKYTLLTQKYDYRSRF